MLCNNKPFSQASISPFKKKKRMAVIYKISNNINEKPYIGSTTETIGKRFSRHWNKARSGLYPNRRLYQAMNELGKDAFHIEIVRDLGDVSKPIMCAQENELILEYDSIKTGYNMKRSIGY